ncbi:MAG: 3'-5' exonuclease [Flavobacteriales bacterium]|nr:3'-5' exonuclease [Flavobacteriales bacterium]|tara:strand:+ start:218 stop:940 length:723 start_codon:yes stop_codon:yes gene_type:complete
MLKHLDLRKILFIDIETVPAIEDFSSLDDEWKALWDRKASFLSKAEEEDAESLYKRAGIYAEFGKVICASLGYLHFREGTKEFRLTSIYGEDEKEVLEKTASLLIRFNKDQDHLLCAHNGKEFDFPFLARRMLIHGIELPYLLDIAGRKPWEVQHLDTMQLWKFGDYKHYTSLKLLCRLFGIASPKSDMDGSQVAEVFYKEKDLKRISEYCQEDTLAVAQLLLKFMGEDPIEANEIIRVE